MAKLAMAMWGDTNDNTNQRDSVAEFFQQCLRIFLPVCMFL